MFANDKAHVWEKEMNYVYIFNYQYQFLIDVR